MNQLETLSKELYLANTTGAELDIVMQLTPTQLLVDQLFHIPNGVQGGEIEIPAVNKWLQYTFQLLGVTAGGVQNACLDHGVAFPLTSLVLIVIFQGAEMRHQWATFTKRAQAHINPENLTVHGDLVQGGNQLLGQLGKERLILKWFARVIGLAFEWVSEDQVDITGEIQLVSTQFAHPQHQHRLWSKRTLRCAMTFTQMCV